MSEGAEEFLDELGRRGREPLLAKVSGTVGLELVEDGEVDQWHLTIERGSITVAHQPGPADCTIRAPKGLFDRLCRGEENAMACVLRGAMACSGDPELLFAIQRVFPGPQEA